MTWLIWNVRGVNKRYKQKEVRKILVNKHIKLAGLIETRVKQHNATRIVQNIVPGWDLHLNEIAWKGEYYTWSNKQQGDERVCSRLDRAIGNHEWMMAWGQVRNIKVPFRFFNIRAEHNKFQDIISAIWAKKLSRDRMGNIWLNLKALKLDLKKLNTEEFKYVGQNIEQARQSLAEIQVQMRRQWTDALQDQEKQTIIKLEKWSLIEESAIKQKSKAKWIQLGDSNNKYFSAVLKERTQRKQIIDYYRNYQGKNCGFL
ncbi:uncharacterized protein LOC132610344 [Lycium barbarum]|uniref:uncharacterized protein LOC132610344 n=1 Tax=Lycium barbarum TaxID=112863 RepID=UPI00293E499B|nr:uncharacterized protein LOC132610344 [Lycium barbarum]